MSNWIKCSERMPEQWQRVLIAHTDYLEPRIACWTDERKWRDEETEVGDMCMYHPGELVTHWMPLPEAPE